MELLAKLEAATQLEFCAQDYPIVEQTEKFKVPLENITDLHTFYENLTAMVSRLTQLTCSLRDSIDHLNEIKRMQYCNSLLIQLLQNPPKTSQKPSKTRYPSQPFVNRIPGAMILPISHESI